MGVGPDIGGMLDSVAGAVRGLASGTSLRPAPLVVLAVPTSERDLLSTVVWMAAGAGVVGALGWAVATFLVTGLPPTAVLGGGLAFGGGLGVIVHVFVLEDEPDSPEEMTVEMSEEDGTGPRPVDLFEASPDPILYYEDGVVRAVNPAFEDAFAASTDALSDAPLREGLMAADPDADAVDEVLEAVERGGAVDATLACETADGSERFRVRLAAVGTDGPNRGYLIYTPSGDGRSP